MLQGLMMGVQLTIGSIIRFAERAHPNAEVVSVTADNPRHRYTYRDLFARSAQLANRLQSLGITAGDRVGTLAWNDHRHLEIYYAVSGMGAVCHTINPRLFPEQVDYIVNHANDRIIFTDPMFVPMLESLAEKLSPVTQFVVLTDEANMPSTTLINAISYEAFISGCEPSYEWPELDENAASSLCYTSGTTGNPKGVLYSHRSTVLHAYASALPDMMGLSCKDSILPIVPMFHVNAWGLPYSSVMVGAKLVLPGAKVADGAVLQSLIEGEQVTFSAGVPTIWLALLSYLKESGQRIDSLQRVIVGGAACPQSIMDEFRDDHGVTVHHAWGMTECSPLGTLNQLKGDMLDRPQDELDRVRLKQGRGVFGVQMGIFDEQGEQLPWDGNAFGELKLRGPWVCSSYYQSERSDSHDQAGWFATGDVATIDTDGFMQITDRTKDIIKSGGEWISSIDLENATIDHEAVAEAAVIGIPHPKWSERPLLIVVLKEGRSADKQVMLDWLDGKVAKWWIPEEVVFVNELPHTATGKVSKKDLRELWGQGKLA